MEAHKWFIFSLNFRYIIFIINFTFCSNIIFDLIVTIMIDKLISDFSNNQLSNFLRNNNSSFVDYLEDFSELISDNEKFTNLYKLGEIEYNNTDKLIV